MDIDEAKLRDFEGGPRAIRPPDTREFAPVDAGGQPVNGSVWRHVRSGTLYRVTGGGAKQELPGNDWGDSVQYVAIRTARASRERRPMPPPCSRRLARFLSQFEPFEAEDDGGPAGETEVIR